MSVPLDGFQFCFCCVTVKTIYPPRYLCKCHHIEFWWREHKSASPPTPSGINEWSLCQMQHRLFLMDFSRKVSERFWFWCLLFYLVSFVVILTVLVLKIKSIKLLSVNGKRAKSPATSTWQPQVSSSGKILTNIHEIKSCGLQFDRTKWDWYSQSILKFNLDTGEREVNGCKATNCTLRNYVKLVGIGN